MTTPIRPVDWFRRDPGGGTLHVRPEANAESCDASPDLRYDVLYHPSYEWWQQLEGGCHQPLPYSSYPVVTRSGLTLAQAREFITGQRVPAEWYTVRPTAKES